MRKCLDFWGLLRTDRTGKQRGRKGTAKNVPETSKQLLWLTEKVNLSVVSRFGCNCQNANVCCKFLNYTSKLEVSFVYTFVFESCLVRNLTDNTNNTTKHGHCSLYNRNATVISHMLFATLISSSLHFLARS